MDMTISFIDDAASQLGEEKRWESQTTPAFPLPLGANAPKYPSRKTSMECILPGKPKHEETYKVEPNGTFPRVLRKKTLAFPLSLRSAAPRHPRRKTSMECIADIPHEEEPYKVETNGTFPHVLQKKTLTFPLSQRSAAPRHPRRKTSMECIAHIAQEEGYKAEPNEAFSIRRKKLVPPRYPRRPAAPSRSRSQASTIHSKMPIRQAMVGCNLGASPFPPLMRSNTVPAPTRNVATSQAA